MGDPTLCISVFCFLTKRTRRLSVQLFVCLFETQLNLTHYLQRIRSKSYLNIQFQEEQSIFTFQEEVLLASLNSRCKNIIGLAQVLHRSLSQFCSFSEIRFYCPRHGHNISDQKLSHILYSLFCPPAIPSSDEYRSFWQTVLSAIWSNHFSAWLTLAFSVTIQG